MVLFIHSAAIEDGHAAEDVLGYQDVPKRLELTWVNKGYRGIRVQNVGAANGIRAAVWGIQIQHHL